MPADMSLQEQADALAAAGEVQPEAEAPEQKESEYHVGQGLQRNDPSDEDIVDDSEPPVGDEPGNSEFHDDPFTPDVLSRSQAYGLPETAARPYDTPQALEQFSAQRDQQMLGMPQGFPTQQQQWQPPQQQPQQQPQQGQQQQAPPPQFEVEKLQMQFDPDVTDPSVISQFQKVNDHWYEQQKAMQDYYESQLDELMDIVQQSNQVTRGLHESWQQDQQRQTAQEYTNSLKSLGGNYSAMFGDDPMNAAYGTPQHNNVSMVLNRAEQIRQGYLQTGSTPPPRAELAKTAAYMLFPEQMKQAAVTGAAKAIKKQPKRTARPTGTTPPQKGKDSAQARWDQAMKAGGFNV